MMNCYIKTLRSNLDNILSSESISPYSFYQGRSFGYRRYDRLKDNIYDNVLRVDMMINDDPEDVIYIELSSDDEQIRNLANKITKGSFYVSKTIYLYPWNCRILFKTVEDARSSIFLCRSSLMNKMWGYFAVGLVEQKGKKSYTVFKPNGGISITREEIDADNKRNKLKGFLYGYYVGLSKSLSPELAKMLQVEMKMYGLATAVAGMRIRLEETVKEIEQLKKIFNANDPNQLRLKRLWSDNVIGSFSSSLDGELFERYLGRFGVLKTTMYAFAAEQGIAVSPRLDSAKMIGSDWRMFAQHIDEYTRGIIDMAVSENKVAEKERVSVKDGIITLQQMRETLYEVVVNEIVSGNTWLSTERVSTNKLEVANELTYRLKEYDEKCGLEWEGSEHQLYMERVRQNIAYSSSFDPNQTNDKGLRALAVYVLKGDMMDELIKFVQIAGIEDYSLVCGLWGANIGYANLPKTFMNRIDLPEQKKSECYLEVCRVLTVENVTSVLDATKFMTDVEQLEASSIKSIWMKESTEDMKKVVLGLTETIEQLKDKSMRLTDAQLSEIRGLLEANDGRINEPLYRQIGMIKGIGKKKLGQIRDVLRPWTEEANDSLLFKESVAEEQKPEAGITTPDILRVIEGCLPDEEVVRKQLEKDINWYLGGQGVITPTIITKLCQYLKSNKEGLGRRGMWVRKLYADVDVSQIERRLTEAFL